MSRDSVILYYLHIKAAADIKCEGTHHRRFQVFKSQSGQQHCLSPPDEGEGRPVIEANSYGHRNVNLSQAEDKLRVKAAICQSKNKVDR